MLNGTALLLPVCKDLGMSNNKAEKQPYQAVLASVKEAMAGTRAAEFARVEPGGPSTTTVKEVAKP